MALSDIQAKHVRKALAECRRVGEPAFLDYYGFRVADTYLLLDRGRFYPSKAIVGAAHWYATGVAWASRDFTGGEKTVESLLTRLKFEVRRRPFDSWPFWQMLEDASGSLQPEFSGWASLTARHALEEQLAYVGVYAIAQAKRRPRSGLPRSVLYIGETVRTLGQRLNEFEKAARGLGTGHSGGCTFNRIHGSDVSDLYVSVVPIRLRGELQRATVSLAERYLIWLYTARYRSAPECNRK